MSDADTLPARLHALHALLGTLAHVGWDEPTATGLVEGQALLATFAEQMADLEAEVQALRETCLAVHELLDEVGIGKPHWSLPGRVTLLSYWMRTSETNARLLGALHSSLPLLERLAHATPPHAPERESVALLVTELRTFAAWEAPPPSVSEPPLVRLCIRGPVEVLACPTWIRLELVGPTTLYPPQRL